MGGQERLVGRAAARCGRVGANGPACFTVGGGSRAAAPARVTCAATSQAAKEMSRYTANVAIVGSVPIGHSSPCGPAGPCVGHGVIGGLSKEYLEAVIFAALRRGIPGM